MNENTLYDNVSNENTEYAGCEKCPVTPEEVAESKASVLNKKRDVKIVSGVVGGVLLGGLAFGLTSMDKEDAPHSEETPDWLADDDVKVAQNVTDEMSFDEAFKVAREEVGAGGAFEWRGGVYGTYTSAEWNGMTASERAQWGEHFDWGHLSPQEGSVASTHITQVEEEHIYVHRVEDSATLHPTPGNVTPEVTHNKVTGTEENEGEFKVLAVVHSEENGQNIGVVQVQGQEAYVIDIDNDMKFDVMAYDRNQDGTISEDEFIDLRDGNVTVESLGGFHITEEYKTQLAQQMQTEESDMDMDYSQELSYSGKGVAEEPLIAEPEVEDSINPVDDYSESAEVYVHQDDIDVHTASGQDLIANEDVPQAEVYHESQAAEVYAGEIPTAEVELAYNDFSYSGEDNLDSEVQSSVSDIDYTPEHTPEIEVPDSGLTQDVPDFDHNDISMTDDYMIDDQQYDGLDSMSDTMA